jgi:surface antigen
MIPLLLRSKAKSAKKELLLIFGVIGFLIILPPIVLVSMTNASALINTGGKDDVTLYTDPAYPGDLYDYGNCTYWVAMRRAQIGEPIPNTWGNAATWAVRAMFDGYVVDHTPSTHAIMQIPGVANGLGHVAFVESVDTDGTWHISEMNVVGFDEVDYTVMPATAVRYYSFIHERSP